MSNETPDMTRASSAAEHGYTCTVTGTASFKPGLTSESQELKFVFTGGLEKLGRREAKELVERFGARVVGSVSKATDYVVAGEDPGSKLDEAKKRGVTILDEAGFLDLLREKGIDAPAG